MSIQDCNSWPSEERKGDPWQMACSYSPYDDMGHLGTVWKILICCHTGVSTNALQLLVP